MAQAADAPSIARIYNQGIDERIATFETRPRSADEIAAGLLAKGEQEPTVVVEQAGQVVAWAGLSVYRARECYAGVGEHAVYVDRAARRKGAGAAALAGLLDTAAARGYWKLVSRIFVDNVASRALHRTLGFREVGLYRRHGRLDGRWIDCVIVEKLLGPAAEGAAVDGERGADSEGTAGDGESAARAGEGAPAGEGERGADGENTAFDGEGLAAAGFLCRSLERIVGCLDELTVEQQRWRPPAPGSNSLLGIAHHALSNAEDNVLGLLGGEPMARQRATEFDDRALDAPSIRAQWAALEPRLVACLAEQTPVTLLESVAHRRRGRLSRFEVLIVALRHAAEHLGQAELTRDLVLAGGPARPGGQGQAGAPARPVLRLAGVGDADAVAACVRRAYAKYDGRLPKPPLPVLADYAAVIAQGLTWLLEQDGACVGVLVLEAEPHALLIENVAVDPAQQGRGLGRVLLDFAETEARRRGLGAVRLYTHARMTENIALYRRRGYVETARRTTHGGRETVFMRKDLSG